MNTVRNLLPLLATALACTLTPAARAQMVPIKNLVDVQGQMTNTVVGRGLVVGLDKTGSQDPITRQHAINFLRHSAGVNFDEADITAGNYALVAVTCDLPPIVNEGQRLDVRINALSESTSLRGGELLPCELQYHDGPQSQTFVIASGRLSVGAALKVNAAEAQFTRNNPQSASILGGGVAVRALVGPLLTEANDLELMLKKPDPELVVRIRDTIATALGDQIDEVSIINAGTVRLALPERMQTRSAALRLLAAIGPEPVRVTPPAKIVIDVDSGTVVAGGDIPISPGVIAVSSITITVVEELVVSQPEPGINNGSTAVVGRSRIAVTNEGAPTERNGEPAVIRGEHTTVEELLENLKALELTPLQIAVVLEELANAGMIHVPVIQR